MVISSIILLCLKVTQPLSLNWKFRLCAYSPLLMVYVLAVMKNNWFGFKHLGYNVMPVGSPFQFFKFQLRIFQRKRVSWNYVLINLLKAIFECVEMRSKEFEKGFIVMHLMKITQHLQTNNVSIFSFFIKTLLRYGSIAISHSPLQIVISLLNMFKWALQISFWKLRVDSYLKAVSCIFSKFFTLELLLLVLYFSLFSAIVLAALVKNLLH